MADEVDPIERTKQVMGGDFWQVSMDRMQESMRAQLEKQSSQNLGQLLNQSSAAQNQSK